VLAGGLGILGLMMGGFAGALAMLATLGTALGLVAVYRNGLRIVAIPSRRVGVAVISVSLIVGLAGAAIAPQPPPAPSAAVNEEKASPSASSPDEVVSVTKRRDTEVETIPFSRSEVEDPDRDVGDSQVVTEGVDGRRTRVWIVTIVDGKETSRVKLSEEVTEPIDEITAIGTRVPPRPPEPTCDPNYSGQCVPIASDVDCAGGSGNGPAYTYGPVRVVGSDIYDLDRDGDGIACD
jgi:hypothetical protein